MKDVRAGRNGRAFRSRGVLVPAAGLALVAAMSAGCASSGGSVAVAPGRPAARVRRSMIAYLGDQSGSLATTFGSSVIGVTGVRFVL